MKSLSIFYKQFMNGFTYIIPLAVIGGVFLNLYQTFDTQIFFYVGSTAVFLVYPILSAFIAYAISDRPGFVIGLVGGALITLGQSGFIGAIIIGFFAGYLIKLFKIVFKKFPISIKGLLPIFIYPLLGIIVISFFYLGMNIIMTPINLFIIDMYDQLNFISLMMIAIVLSSMMVYDLGGPINKLAYVIGVSSILSGTPNILMTTVMIAGMIPPLSIALASTFFKHKFTEEEQKLAKLNYLMGLSFISEGALSFIKKDKNIFVIFMIGAISSAFLTVYFNVTSNIAHGGILAIFFISNWLLFLLIVIGISLFTAILLGIILPKIKKQDFV